MSAVPQQHLLTAEEFAALPSEGLRLELVRGEISAMPPAFDDHGKSTMRLGGLATHYVLEHDLGEVYAAETGFLLARNPDTVRAPDFAFIAKDRLPPSRPKPGWVEVVPDLVAEVVSSGDRISEVHEKVRMWLDAGVRLVWVVFPAPRVIEAHRAGRDVVTLREGGALDGEDVVPGFSAPVALIFG